MKIILEDMNNNIIKIIKNVNSEKFFNYSSRVKKIRYNDDFQLFDKLNQDLIVLSPSKNNDDFIIEFISKNYLDYINNNSLDYIGFHDDLSVQEKRSFIDFDYQKIIGRYFFESFPFINTNQLKNMFFNVFKTGTPFEFRELKYIDDILISIYRHKIFLSDEKLFHTGYFENDLELLYYAGEDFFYKSERPYIVIDGHDVLKVNDTFLDVFNIDKDEILGEHDLSVLNLIDIDFNQLKIYLNNLLNRKSFYDIFEFSIDDFRDIHVFPNESRPDSDLGAVEELGVGSDSCNDDSITFDSDSVDSSFGTVSDRDLAFGFVSEKDSPLADSNNSHKAPNDYHNKNHVLRAYASPSIYDSSPAIKIFFKNIKEEKKYKNESKYLRDTLSLVQNKNSLAVLIKNKSKHESDSVFEENLINDKIERLDSFHFDDGENLENFLAVLSKDTLYSSGIYNILDLDSNCSLDNINLFDYIIDLDKQDFMDEMESFSKNYNLINTNFRIKSKDNREKYLNFIIEGEFDENGNNVDYIGFIKDNSSRFYHEKELKDSLSDMDLLLNEVLDINSKLINMTNSEELLQENSYDFIMDLLNLFIKIMDNQLERGSLKKDILQNIQLIMHVLVLIHEHLDSGGNFNLLNINIKNYIEEILLYLYGNSDLNLKYDLDLIDLKADIGTVAYLGILIYEFVFNVLSYIIMDKKYTHVSISLKKENGEGILAIKNEYGDLNNLNKMDLTIVSYIIGSLNFRLENDDEGYKIIFPITNDVINSFNS